MENTRWDYSPIVTRKPFTLPNKARIAVWPVLCVEYFDIGLPIPGGRSPTAPDMFSYPSYDYGNRIGFWRIKDLLDKYKIKATMAINSEICTHYPLIAQEALKDGWEFMAHSHTNSRFLGNLKVEEQKEIIHSSLATLEKIAGYRPKGWRSSGMNTSFETPDLLAEAGIKYISDWANDDQPYLVNVKSGKMISLPSDNVPDLRFADKSPSHYVEEVKAHFDTLYREGAGQARTFPFCLHTFEIGKPSKIVVLEQLLDYMMRHKQVWFTTGGELAKWYFEEYLGDKEAFK